MTLDRRTANGRRRARWSAAAFRYEVVEEDAATAVERAGELGGTDGSGSAAALGATAP